MKPPWLALAVAAAALSPPARALDLLQVWEGARQHAPDAAAARAARDAGAARRIQAGAQWRPTVTLEGGVSRASSETAARGARFSAPGFGQSGGVAFDTSINGGTATRYAVSLRQPVYSAQRSARSRQLEIGADVAEAEWIQARQALMLRSADLYFQLALASERLRLLKRQQEAVERMLAEARDRFRIGDRPVTDVHEATARSAALQAQRLAAETELQLAQVAVVDLSGQPAFEGRLPLPAGMPEPEKTTLPDWLARATRGNPGLLLAEAQLQAAQAQAQASRAAFSPTVDVVAQFGRERLSGDGDFGSASNTERNGAIGVQVAVPLYTGGLRSAQHAEEQALVDKARADLERARQQVAQQTRAAWLELAVGRSQTRALATALEASRARLDATRTGLQAGDRTTLDLLNAENDAAGAELALLDARIRLLTNRLRLAALAGELDDTTLQQANAQLR